MMCTAWLACSTTGMLFYNSMLSLPMLLGAVALRGEPARLGSYPLLWDPQFQLVVSEGCAWPRWFVAVAVRVLSRLHAWGSASTGGLSPRSTLMWRTSLSLCAASAGLGAGHVHQPLHLCVHPSQRAAHDVGGR